MGKTKILVVEDERIVAKDIQNSLISLGYEVPAITSTGEEAILIAEDLKPDLILMDIVLKGEIDGIEAANIIRTKLKIPIIYLTAYEDSKTLNRAKETDPLGYILKPFQERELNTTLEMALYKHKMETRLLESEERYRSLVELSPDGIAIIIDDKFVFVNSAALKLLCLKTSEELYNKYLYAFIESKFLTVIKERKSKSASSETNHLFIETQLKRADGSVIEVEIAAVPFQYEGKKATQLIIRDITDRKLAELELKSAYSELKETQQALINNEKLAALGRFAAGIAHEIRNPLANISASAQFFATKYKIDDEMNKYLDVIIRNTDTANKIIKELLDFTSPRKSSLSKDNLKPVIQHVCELVKPRCSSQKINLQVDTEKDIPDILINKQKLEQAFMNFISNAIDSMPDGGTLKITTSNNIPKNTIMVTFEDTGTGISDEDINKIFEPFFTTKDHGTGLGLSLAYQIIKSHNGSIEVSSKVGKGTVINIIFQNDHIT